MSHSQGNYGTLPEQHSPSHPHQTPNNHQARDSSGKPTQNESPIHSPEAQREALQAAIIDKKIKEEFKWYIYGLWTMLGLMVLGWILLVLGAFSLSAIWTWTYAIFWAAALVLPILGLIAYYQRSLKLTELFQQALVVLTVVVALLTVFGTEPWNVVMLVAFAYLIYGNWRLIRLYKEKKDLHIDDLKKAAQDYLIAQAGGVHGAHTNIDVKI